MSSEIDRQAEHVRTDGTTFRVLASFLAFSTTAKQHCLCVKEGSSELSFLLQDLSLPPLVAVEYD